MPNSSRTWRWFSAMLSLISVTGQIRLDQAHPDGPPWSAPINLGTTVNSSTDETQVAITHSGFSLYFSSDHPGGFEYQDLWVSRRTSVGASWRVPRNLGPTVNGLNGEIGPS